MELLVTACNSLGGIYTLNTDTFELKQRLYHETKGICLDEQNYIYTYSNDFQKILKYNNDFNLIKDVDAPRDSHGMFYYKNNIILIDTYYDNILIYDKNLNFINKIGFNSDTEIIDLLHMNDCFIYNDNIYLSMFRDAETGHRVKKEIFRKDINNINKIGIVKKRSLSDFSNNLGETIIKNLYQPHSPLIYENIFAVCDSRNCKVKFYNINNMKCFKEYKTNAFTRGLLITNDHIYIGVSNSVFHKSNEDFENSKCGIEILNKKTFEKVNFIPAPNNEIYSIINYK